MSSKNDPVFAQEGSELTQEERHGQPMACLCAADYKVEEWRETKVEVGDNVSVE